MLTYTRKNVGIEIRSLLEWQLICKQMEKNVHLILVQRPHCMNFVESWLCRNEFVK